MSIWGIGIDLVSVARIRTALDRHGDKFQTRVFTVNERADCLSRAEPALHFAARFCAKEAAYKAMGGLDGCRWTDFEVLPAAQQTPPRMIFHGVVENFLQRQNIVRSHLSLSHSSETAMATVIFEVAT